MQVAIGTPMPPSGTLRRSVTCRAGKGLMSSTLITFARAVPVTCCHRSHAAPCTVTIHGSTAQHWSTRHARNRPCLASATAATDAAASEAINWDEVYAGGPLPGRFVGPLEVQQVEGKGRGLVATRDLNAGELLLVSLPLVFLNSSEQDQGAPPTTQQLLAQMGAQMYTPHQLSWLRALYAGDAHGQGGPVPSLNSGGETQQGEARALTNADLDESLRFNVLALNQNAGVFPDLITSISRGQQPVGYLGLWPEWSMINHSCVPNAEWMVIGDRMVVRASKKLTKGSEVTVSYLSSSSALRPAAERLMDLREGWGFACGCPRCEVEMDDTHVELVQATQALDAAVMYDIAPNIQAALGVGGEEAPSPTTALSVVDSALTRLRSLVSAFDAKLTTAVATGGPTGDPEVVSWLRASAFQAYTVQAQLQDLRGQLKAAVAGVEERDLAEVTQLVQDEGVALSVSERIVPGSDQQVLARVRVWAALQQTQGPESKASEKAGEEAVRTVRLRYGDLKEETAALLLQATAVALSG